MIQVELETSKAQSVVFKSPKAIETITCEIPNDLQDLIALSKLGDKYRIITLPERQKIGLKLQLGNE